MMMLRVLKAEMIFENIGRKQKILRDCRSDYGKLNMLYTYKIVFDEKNSFNEFLKTIAQQVSDIYGLDKKT